MNPLFFQLPLKPLIGPLTKAALLVFSIFILGCQSTHPTKPVTSPKETLFHQDSTVYFANRKASISMRASFSNTIEATTDRQKPLNIQPLATGYKLQFRSIQSENLLIGKVSIVAGGKKIDLTEGSFFVPSNKGITLSLSLTDTQFLTQHSDAVLRFTADDVSQLLSIKQHKISEFILPPAN